jgi:hypothetical protein
VAGGRLLGRRCILPGVPAGSWQYDRRIFSEPFIPAGQRARWVRVVTEAAYHAYANPVPGEEPTPPADHQVTDFPLSLVWLE